MEQPVAWATDRVGLTDTSELKFAEAIWASGDVFTVLGVDAMLGRTFDRRDDRRGGGPDGPVALISFAFWQRRFGGTVDTVGHTLTIEHVPFTIVGITPPGFFGLNVGAAFDVILPLETEPLLGRVPKRLDSPHWTWLNVIARLEPGETTQSVTSALAAAQPRIREATMPAFTHANDRDRFFSAAWVAAAAPGGVSRLRRQYSVALLTLLAVVGVVLLVACSSIATLMLARWAVRRHEFAIRRALGASRGRLLRQLIVESLLLSAIGAALGLAIAQWGSQLLVAQLSTWASTAFLDLSLDWRVLSVTIGMTACTAFLFGILPAGGLLGAPATNPVQTPARSLADNATGGMMVIVQVALSLVLVVGAGLFLRSFMALAYRDLGFDRSRVLVGVVDARRSVVPAAGRAALYERVRAAVAAVPGVERAATSMATPLGSSGVRFTPDISIPDNPAWAGEQVRILSTPVSPGWFSTFGTRIVAGRDFDAHDGKGSPDVVIVNSAFARRYFGGATPLGSTLVEVAGPADRRPLEIVGLVQDAAFTTVRDEVEPTIYKPLAQRLDDELLTSIPTFSVSVRAVENLSPDLLRDSVAAAIDEVDPNLAVMFQTVTETLSVFYIRERLLAMLSGFFGGLALLLAAIGLYGVTAYSVSARRREIGICMALGARSRGIAWMVLRRVAWHAAIGLVAGALVSFWAAKFVRTLLYDLDARDQLTFDAAAGVMAIVAALAGWLPARRASQTDPAVVLREG